MKLAFALAAPLLLAALALPAQAADIKVAIKGFAFTPADVTAVAGDTITFTNADSTTHTATAVDGAFDTGQIAPGKSATVTVAAAGAHTYHCQIHPSMTGTVTVK